MTLTRSAKMFIGLMVLGAAAMVIRAGALRQTWHPAVAFALLAVALATSRMKVRFPGMNGNMSVNLPFLLLAVVTTSPIEAILVAGAATIVQTLPKAGGQLMPVRMLFNVSMSAVATGTAGLLFHASSLTRLHWFSLQMLLAATTAVFFVGQTVPVSIIVALTDGGTVQRVWTSLVRLTFPYYVCSAGVTSMASSSGHTGGTAAALVLFPVMYGIYSSYMLYFQKTGVGTHPPRAMTTAAGA